MPPTLIDGIMTNFEKYIFTETIQIIMTVFSQLLTLYSRSDTLDSYVDLRAGGFSTRFLAPYARLSYHVVFCMVIA